MENQDQDQAKGAVEQNGPGEKTNTSLDEQLGHRNQDVLNKVNDSDYPEPGQNAEHSGEPQGRNQLDQDTQMGGNNPEGATQDQDPGQRQKRNQGGQKDDPLAA